MKEEKNKKDQEQSDVFRLELREVHSNICNDVKDQIFRLSQRKETSDAVEVMAISNSNNFSHIERGATNHAFCIFRLYKNFFLPRH